MHPQGEIAGRLPAPRGGDKETLDQPIPLVYKRLQTMAHARPAGRDPGGSLETTGLVHEPHLELVDQSRTEWRDRTHCVPVAATAIRGSIADRARRRNAQKPGGMVRARVLDDADPDVNARTEEVLAPDQALTRLGALSERMVRMVELRFFAGLPIAETAEILKLDSRPVNRDWRAARALLHRAPSGAEAT